MPSGDPGLLVLADDLSGAAEAAATLRAPVPILLTGPSTVATEAPAGDCAFDLDCRHLSPAEAETRTSAALRELRTERWQTGEDRRVICIKIDSLLRGNVTAHLRAALHAGSGPVIFAPALPEQHRTVVEGVPLIDGRPLSSTSAWSIEAEPAPDHLRDLCPVPPAHIGLDSLRTGALRSLVSAVEDSRLTIADAETTEDLGRIVELAASSSATLIGSAAIARAFAARRPTSAGASPRTRAAGDPDARVLMILGTAADRVSDQIAHLRRHAAIDVLDIAAAEVLGWTVDPGALATAAASARTRLATGDLVVRLTDDGEAVDPRPLPGMLAEFTAALLRASEPVHLVAAGGETARALFDRLGITALDALREVHPGAVLSAVGAAAADSTLATRLRNVVTRPGGHGDEDSLTLIHTALTTAPAAPGTENHEGEHMNALPTVAVTMGDGAGVGPEICVAACLDPTVLAVANPVVVGDAARLEQAAGILGRAVEIRTVGSPAEAERSADVINVIDLGLLPSDLPWGALSPVAGDAAFRYIERAASLAMSGEVQAICTAPLNKEALHSAGHNYPGHTEMLAALTGTDEVSMMLSSPKLRVIHVTTHIGLVDAINRIEPGLVERTVRRGHEALVRAGIQRPHIGVCAINPHAGENGLFGYGEEEEKIVPAIEKLTADGVDAVGPLPADTAFFLAGRGDYDLIVAMYHDQGHGPIKVLGIEAGVNITVGLPVIRTSVDHGTAFDIAGTGTVDTESMSEAMRQAATLASA